MEDPKYLLKVTFGSTLKLEQAENRIFKTTKKENPQVEFVNPVLELQQARQYFDAVMYDAMATSKECEYYLYRGVRKTLVLHHCTSSEESSL